MIAVISAIMIVITSLAVTLVTSTPNYHNIMESDFTRSAKNNAYLYGWEWAQINVRSGNLIIGTNQNINTPDASEPLTKKDNVTAQSLESNIKLAPEKDVPATGSTPLIPKYSQIEIAVEKK